MITQIEASQVRIYMTADGRVAIEQSAASVVFITPDQILDIIGQLHTQLHACYDYCASWKDNGDVAEG